MIKWINQSLCIFFASVITNLSLFVVLAFFTRLVMLFWLKDEDLIVDFSSVLPVFIMGLRFDLKIGVIFALLVALPLFYFTPTNRFIRIWQSTLWVVVLIVLVANYGYFSFYGSPFNALVFGLFDDDTFAIIQTLISDFPIIKMTIFIVLAVIFLMKINVLISSKLTQIFLNRLKKSIFAPIAYLCFFLCLGVMAKGTLAGVALQRQHMVVTNNSFLNNLVPNYLSSLYYALAAKKNEPKMSDTEVLVRQLGFSSVFEAADALGFKVTTEEELLNLLYTKSEFSSEQYEHLKMDRQKSNNVLSSKHAPKDLLFFLMESMGQEPFIYQNDAFDVLGELNRAKAFACHFDNFDAIQNGTFPSLEGILYHSPITPLTQGKYAYNTMPWSVAMRLKEAGYHTVFFTAGRASWRNLDQSLPNQGFDEVIDAGFILQNYPESYMDMWGVPDEFLFAAITDYRKNYQIAQKAAVEKVPLFIFVLTITNHPPYTLPLNEESPHLDLTYWLGDKSSPLLENNLKTFRYSANQLGKFVLNAKEDIMANRLVIAATGDHNARTFGLYTGLNRASLAHKVPFLVWANKENCGHQLHLPASHRDMFPTLFELLNVEMSYLKSGRNLFDDRFDGQNALALQFTGDVRNFQNQWSLLNTSSCELDCKNDPLISIESHSNCPQINHNETKICQQFIQQDLEARAHLALADWHIRYQLTQKE
ncbi:LTA synthase family protein [Thorsellia kenyensis]|uniref:LTA synthase family protein n=1 Tax=Thorsellia kenyensis TaxID=1549888 RepID=A0ABV6C9S8_9GAMM